MWTDSRPAVVLDDTTSYTDCVKRKLGWQESKLLVKDCLSDGANKLSLKIIERRLAGKQVRQTASSHLLLTGSILKHKVPSGGGVTERTAAGKFSEDRPMAYNGIFAEGFRQKKYESVPELAAHGSELQAAHVSSPPDMHQLRSAAATGGIVEQAQDANHGLELKLLSGGASPSPRGIENWGTASPFAAFAMLPSPAMELFDPTDISCMLNHPETILVANDDEEEATVFVNENGETMAFNSEFDAFEEETFGADLPMPFLERNLCSASDDVEIKRTSNATTKLELPQLHNLNSPSAMGKHETLDTPNCGISLQNESFRASSQTDSSNHEVPQQDDIGREDARRRQSRRRHIEFDKKCGSALTSNLDSKSASTPSLGGRPHGSGRAQATASGSPWAGISEEELKRIRRVKNRASVEKCRTKQRLRMEALQVEMEALKGENLVLRQVTELVDANARTVAGQVLAVTGHRLNLG